MSVHLISAPEAMARYDQFDAIIDARSEGEYAEDHLPGALNWPSLNNPERVQVGTLYKQVGPFEVGGVHGDELDLAGPLAQLGLARAGRRR